MRSLLNLRMYEVILEKKYNYQDLLFALCESCYWMAAIFMKIERYQCPTWLSKQVTLIPLCLVEKYLAHCSS
jgi:hypothetical protein